MNGFLMYFRDAPTSRMMPISSLRTVMELRMVLLTRTLEMPMSTMTNTTPTALIVFVKLSSWLTCCLPYVTFPSVFPPSAIEANLSLFAIFAAMPSTSFASFIVTTMEPGNGFSPSRAVCTFDASSSPIDLR